MISSKLSNAINDYLKHEPEDKLLHLLERSSSRVDESTLTIIADQTIHRIPEEQCIGTVYEFSRGQIPTSSDKETEQHIVSCLQKLYLELRSKNWKRVRIIVSGHALLSMQIKSLVYRVLHIDTEDIGFFGQDGYREIRIDFRKDIVFYVGN